MSEELATANIESEVNTAIEATMPQATQEATAEGPAIPEKFGGDVSKLVESYNHLETKIGSMYSVPTEDSSPERWQEFNERVVSTGKYIPRPDSTNPESMDQFYSAIGRPASPEDYQVNLSAEAQQFIDPGLLGQYAQVAYETGVSNEQAQKFLDFELSRINTEAQRSLEQRNISEQTLRQTWGADYDNRMAGAKAALNAYSQTYPDAAAELMNGPAGNNPALIAMLSELGHSLREQGHVGMSNAPQYGMSSAEAKDKIREITDNKAHPYFDASHPGHHEAVEKVKKLYTAAYPEA